MVGQTENAVPEAPPLTVALDGESARALARQASIVQDLGFVMDCCKRLLLVLDQPEADRDEIVPLALWSSALVAYGRCFGEGCLTVDDVRNLPLQGEVVTFHEWVLGERDKLTEPSADPFSTAKVAAALTPREREERRIEGIAVFSVSRVLIDATGVRQLGGLTSELARRLAAKARKQEESALSDARQLGLDALSALPPLPGQSPGHPD